MKAFACGSKRINFISRIRFRQGLKTSIKDYFTTFDVTSKYVKQT